MAMNRVKAQAPVLQIYFSDVFKISPDALEKYGAFNMSLVSDLPLFIDPFLLFNSSKKEYQELHAQIIRYVRFLRDKSSSGQIPAGLLQAWFTFKEVKQNWLGFSETGNRGSGLGKEFAKSLNQNLATVFADFGEEKITKSPHLEKLALIRDGVGKDNISDFTTTLIKRYLLSYTQEFARKHISPDLRRNFTVNKVLFNYETETWVPEIFDLPCFEDDFIMLTPRDILTKDETWINRADLLSGFDQITNALGNQELRELINNHFPKAVSGGSHSR